MFDINDIAKTAFEPVLFTPLQRAQKDGYVAVSRKLIYCFIEPLQSVFSFVFLKLKKEGLSNLTNPPKH